MVTGHRKRLMCQLAILALLFGYSALALGQPAALDPAIQFDLAPALEMPLFLDSIIDEGLPVTPENDKAFLALPLSYDPTRAKCSIARKTIGGPDAKSFYGVRLLSPSQWPPQFRGDGEAPVYERVDLDPTNGRNGHSVSLAARNLSPPRRTETEKGKPAKPAARADSLEASGRAALLFEVSKRAKEFSISLPPVGDITIDIEYLRSVRDPIPLRDEQAMGDSIPPAVAENLKLIIEGSGPIAGLALERLALARLSWPPVSTARWVLSVDMEVTALAASPEPLVQRALWHYWVLGGSVNQPSVVVSSPLLDFLSVGDDDLQLAWLVLIQRGLGLIPVGPDWTGFASPGIHAESGPAMSTKVLGSILRSENDNVCRSAVDLLFRIKGSSDDWSALAQASSTAQSLAAAKLDSLTDAASSSGLLRMLLLSPNPNAAEKIAAECERRKIAIVRDDDPILTADERLDTPESRIAWLKSLTGVDLRRVLYSVPVANLVQRGLVEPSSTPEPGEYRAALGTMMVRQAGRLLAAAPTAVAKTKGSRDGAFPVMVSLVGVDPLVLSLIESARQGPRTLRASALVTLLQFGFAGEAAQSLIDAKTTVAQRDLLLKELAAKDEMIMSRDAFLALLGCLLRKECEPQASWILDRIEAIREKTPPGQRWRVAAAIKAGLNFGDFDALIARLDPPVADKARRLLIELGHLTPQDAERLAGARDAAERAKMFDRIDFRRGQLADGEYGCIAIVETMSSAPLEHDAAGRQVGGRWYPPVRRTVALPNVRITAKDNSADADDLKFSVFAGDKAIGEGLILNRARSIGGPARFSPPLQVAPWHALCDGRLSDAGPRETTIGPMVLQHRAVVNPLTPGTMNLDLKDILRTALRSQKTFTDDEIKDLLPEALTVTLRYASFGSYYGCAPAQMESAGPDQKLMLLGLMVVMEKVE